MAHTGQCLNGLGEIMGEDTPVFSTAPVATHPGQSGAAHGVIDGLLSKTNTQTDPESCYKFESILTDKHFIPTETNAI